MRRALAIGGAGIVVGAAGFLLWARLLAGEPVLPGVPGGALRGELAREPVRDWSFANHEPYLLVESRAGRLPYSARVWFIAHRGRLHLLLPSFFGDGLQRRLVRDPRVRVSVEGRLYDLVAVPVTDDDAIAALVAPVLRRQFAIEIEGPARLVPSAAGVEMAVFRLDEPPGDPP